MVARKTLFYRQSQWDGLCGFYASLNAMWALFPKLREEEPEDLYNDYFGDQARQRQVFDEAVSLLSRVGGTNIRTLVSHPLIGGIDQFQVIELVELMGRYWRLPLEAVQLEEVHGGLSLNAFLKRESEMGEFAMSCSLNEGEHWGTVYRDENNIFQLVDPGGEDDDCALNLRAGKRPDHRSGVLIRRK